MKKNLKKFIKIAITMIITLCLCVVVWGHKSNADAGSHVSHSSGGSSHSSSSSSHSYSSSSSSRSSSSSSSGDASPGEVLVSFIILIIIIIIISKAQRKSGINGTNTSGIKLANNPNAIKTIKELLPNFNETEFLQNGYKIFLDIEDAWMNFELDKVHNIMTDEMFNMYDSQLAGFEIKGEQNIMKDFKLVSSAITGANKQNDNIEIKTQYIVEFYDYVIDKESKKVVNGNSTRKVRMHYEFTFIMSDTQEKIDTCPNCGAKVEVNSAGTCEYCGSKIVGKNTNWVISKKVCIKQTNL